MKTASMEKAEAFAIKAHEGQYRKSDGTPMVTHPIRVAKLLQSAGFPEAVVIAGYLHDTVEDTDVTLEDIEREFGSEVRAIVAGNTEDKTKTWEERKKHTVDALKTAPMSIRALVIADKLDNLSSLAFALDDVGEDIWNAFKYGRKENAWYFQSVLTSMYVPPTEMSLSDYPEFFKVYAALVHQVFCPHMTDSAA